MRKIGIVVAMSKEYDSLAELLPSQSSKVIYSGIEFSIYNINDCEIIIARCGIGEIYAASATSLLVCLFGADELINYGFAGALNGDHKLFDVLAIRDIVHYDMDLTAFGNKIGQYDDRDSELWLCDEELTTKLLGSKGAEFVRIASADKFIKNSADKKKIASSFGAALCDMESAGIAVVANKSGVPFASIKLVVDGVEGDSSVAFEENAKNGATSLAKIIYNYITAEGL